METFNDASLTPDQLKMLTLQFMGQHLTGELKELDKNLVAKNSTLQGMVLDPNAVLNSIPSQSVAPQQTPPQLSVQQPILQVHESIPTVTQLTTAASSLIDQNQLEFSFETSPLSERIFDILQRIEKKLSIIEERAHAIEDVKKKD